jgi:hypothetical protein
MAVPHTQASKKDLLRNFLRKQQEIKKTVCHQIIQREPLVLPLARPIDTEDASKTNQQGKWVSFDYPF